MKTRYLLFALVAVAGGLAGFGLQRWLSHDQTMPWENVRAGAIGLEVGDPRPDVTLPDITGKTRSLSEFNGQVVVLNFWATWCKPCREEMPELMSLQKEYADKGLQVVGIAIDTPEQVKEFLDEVGVDYPVLVGEMPAVDASHAYGNRLGVLPYTVIIDRDGFVRELYARQVSRELLEPDLKPLL